LLSVSASLERPERFEFWPDVETLLANLELEAFAAEEDELAEAILAEDELSPDLLLEDERPANSFAAPDLDEELEDDDLEVPEDPLLPLSVGSSADLVLDVVEAT
jgi:hypothetical protein